MSGNRTITSVEASFGLGEALVSGLVNPDVYTVRDDEVVARKVAIRQQQPALTDAQVVQLAALGRRIEAHFGRPQDIEWCLVDGAFHIVQSRPITTLFPIPAAGDGENHVYVSVGHQQMMTAAMKPLGLSLFQLTALRPMFEAGGRLFVEVTRALESPASRAGLLAVLGTCHPADPRGTAHSRARHLRVRRASALSCALLIAAPGGGADGRKRRQGPGAGHWRDGLLRRASGARAHSARLPGARAGAAEQRHLQAA